MDAVPAVRSHGARQLTAPATQYVLFYWELSVFVATCVAFRRTFETTECTPVRIATGLCEVRILSEASDCSSLQKSFTTMGGPPVASEGSLRGLKRPGPEADHSVHLVPRVRAEQNLTLQPYLNGQPHLPPLYLLSSSQIHRPLWHCYFAEAVILRVDLPLLPRYAVRVAKSVDI